MADGLSPVYSDGHAVPVRLEAAEKLLADERDRSQSLNTRGTATAAAGVAIVALLRELIGTAVIADDRARLAESLLDVSAGCIVLATASAIGVVILGVLRPVKIELAANTELELWLESEGMAESERAAQYTLLASAVDATISRRAVNEGKADWLDVTYRLQTAALIAALVMLVTLAS